MLDACLGECGHALLAALTRHPPLCHGCMWRQENIKRCVCLVHDPERSSKRGGLALKAVKLTQPFMDLHRSNSFTGEK